MLLFKTLYLCKKFILYNLSNTELEDGEKKPIIKVSFCCFMEKHSLEY